jgi:hypothetical protein
MGLNKDAMAAARELPRDDEPDAADPWTLDDRLAALLHQHVDEETYWTIHWMIAAASKRDTAQLLNELKAHRAIEPAILDALSQHIIDSGQVYPDCCAGWWQDAADDPSEGAAS